MNVGQEYTRARSVIGIITALPMELNAVYAVVGIQHDPSRDLPRALPIRLL